MRNWALRVASHPRHGGGHLARSKVLAKALRERGENVTMVLDEGADQARARLEAEGLHCCTRREALGRDWSGAVLDGYDILRDETPYWIELATRVAVIDDFLDPPCDVSLVVNGAPHLSGEDVSGIPALLGSRYALIDPGYAALPVRDRTIPVAHVLVSFGRLDPDNLAGRAVEAIAALEDPPSVNVIMAADSPHIAAVKKGLIALGDTGTLTLDAPDLLEPLSGADLAVGAGGVSLLERMAAGVPSITVPIIDNQRLFVQGAVDAGGTLDGSVSGEATVDSLRHMIEAAISAASLRERISEAGRRLVDGEGPARVAHALSSLAGSSHKTGQTIGKPQRIRQ